MLARRVTSLGRPYTPFIRPSTLSLQRRHKSSTVGFLIDDPYIPRYALLSSQQESLKRSSAYQHLTDCNLCPRLCGVNRFKTTGTCLVGADVVVNTIAPHFGEEPCITGSKGSGSVFFSGCNLRCVFCQNYDIAHQKNGQHMSPEELGEWFVKLVEVGGCHNINLVTPEHVVPQVVLAILHAKGLGLGVPIVYNTSSFDSLESIELLDGLVDIYLADFKVWNPATSKRLLKAENYADTAKESIQAMQNQVGDLVFNSNGLAKRGVLLRHLVMPGHEEEGKYIVRWLAENVSKNLYVHVMEQYHPRAHVGKGRRHTKAGGASDIADGVVEVGGVPAGEKAKKEVRYQDINRAVKMSEVDSVKAAAEEAGLWRFVEVADKAGFSV